MGFGHAAEGDNEGVDEISRQRSGGQWDANLEGLGKPGLLRGERVALYSRRKWSTAAPEYLTRPTKY